MSDGFMDLADVAPGIEDELFLGELCFPRHPDVPHPDDAMLHDWLASLVPGRFGHILDALARAPAVTAPSTR